MKKYIGGIDAGGTTFKCGLREDGGDWVARKRIATTSPENTVAESAEFFKDALARLDASTAELIALGLASFGPLNLDSESDGYGSLLGTPKPSWSGFPIRQAFADALRTSVSIDTDVNAALLAEMAEGAAIGVANAAYITVGTGIGAGIATARQIVGRPRHPEFGHIPVERTERDKDFSGVCSYHATCLEGMASVTALKARFGDPVDWEADHQGWDIVADYLAQACRVISLTACAEKIVLGGGLMTSPHILPRIHIQYVNQMAGYLNVDIHDAEDLIVTPHLGDDAGLLGAVLLVS
jgi:fructokinase